MRFYFSLQYKRLERWFQESGVNPIIGIIFFVMAFILGSVYLFYKTEFAKWVYVLIGISTMINLGEKKRTNRLDSIFSAREYWQLRLLENGLVAFPFIVYLIYQQYYLLALSLLFAGGLLATFKFRKNTQFKILTPFKKFPFEFIIGFRKYYALIIIAYFITIKSIQVGNYNLGLFALALIFLTGMSFNLKPEHKYFVWIYAEDSKKFLKNKVATSIICSTILIVPPLIVLSLMFTEYIWPTLAVCGLGYLFLCLVILAKYSAFPKEMNLPQGILLALTIWFPPMLIIVMPLFYKKSIQNLNTLLE